MDSGAGNHVSVCHDCSCKEGGYITLAIIVCLILLPILIAWTLLGFMLTRSSIVSVSVGWIVFSVFAIVAIAIDPFEWGYIFGIGLDLFIVTIIILGYEWPQTWKLSRIIVLYALLVAAITVSVLALTQFSQDGAISGGLSNLIQLQTRHVTRKLTSSPDSSVDTLEVASEADLMDAMNDAAIISGTIIIAWIILCDQNLWLPASEEKLLESETRVLKTMCSNKVIQLVVDGLGTLIVTDTDILTIPSSSSDDATRTGIEDGLEDGSSSAALKGGRETSSNNNNNNYNSNSNSKRRSSKDRPILVLVHGYASANCYWAPVLGRLQQHFRVYCVELPGWGRSDRVTWTSSTPDEVLSCYSEGIERWRIVMGLEKFVLLGHSLGSHACAAYAVTYPHRVSHLIFASPAGVGMPPEQMMRKIDQSTLLEYEFDSPSDSGASTLSQSSFRKNFQFSQFTYSFLSLVWESNLTPMDGIRWLGPLGHAAIAGILERRALKSGKDSYLRKLTPEQAQALIDFTYQNQAMPPSGERALAPIFMPGAYAKKPLCLWLRGKDYRPRVRNDPNSPSKRGGDDRLFYRGSSSSVSSQASRDESQDERCSLLNDNSAPHENNSPPNSPSRNSRASSRTIDCPVSLIYGSPGDPSAGHDWMNCAYGNQLCDQLRREGVDARLYQMRGVVGHINYMENPEEFCFLVAQACFQREEFQPLYRPKEPDH